MRVCKVENCGRKITRGYYCSKHYQQLAKHGKIMPDRIISIGCRVDGCNRKHGAKGYCNRHYAQFLKHGRVLPERVYICKVDGCDGKHVGFGYCKRHYRQFKKYGKIIPDVIRPEKCMVVWCSNKHRAKGYCNRHYQQMVQRGRIINRTQQDPNVIIQHGKIGLIHIYNKKGNHKATTIIDSEDIIKIANIKWHINHEGYVKGEYNKKKVALHRLINQTPLGQKTDHINLRKLDNRKCNLRSCTDLQNQGNRKALKNNTSGYKGVHWCKIRRKWIAQISKKHKRIYLGAFNNIKDAVKIYNFEAKKYWGEFAYLNKQPQ